MCILLAIVVFMLGLQQLWIDPLVKLAVIYGVPSLIFSPLSLLYGPHLFHRNLPPLLLIAQLLVLDQINRLVMPPCNVLLPFHAISDSDGHSCPTRCSLNVDGVQTTFVALIHCYAVFKGIPFRTGKHPALLDLGVIKPIAEMFAAIVGKVFLSCGDLGWVLFGLAVVPCPIRQEVLLVEGAGLVETQLVVPHNKIMRSVRTNYNYLI